MTSDFIVFDHPALLFLLFIFILLIIFDIVKRKNKFKLSFELEKKLRLNAVFFRLFLFFSIIALAGPRWGMSYTPSEYRRGLDVVFAIDISRSMDIEDASAAGRYTTRLERGLLIARETIASVSGARFAAAIGRGRGYLAVPLTHDNEAALVFLESIDGSSMTGRSTNLESLVEAAERAFQTASPAQKIIVLISDGESHSGVLRNAIIRCARENIIVNTVAVGSDEGRQITIQTDDAAGESSAMAVISRRDAAVMRTAAERTGGIYIDGNREDASAALAAHILSFSQEIGIAQTGVEKTNSGSGNREPKQRRALFIVLAIVFYAASKFVTRNFRLPLVSLISVFILFTSCTEGKLLLLEANYLSSRGRYDEAIALYSRALNHQEASAYAEYGLGLTFYSLDEGSDALIRYENSQALLRTLSHNEHRELRFRNHYNTGIILFEEGDYQSASIAFREALRADPKRIEAKRNLELSLLSLSMEANRQNRAEERQEQREILFEYLRQEEQQKWRSREWTQEENYSGLDY